MSSRNLSSSHSSSVSGACGALLQHLCFPLLILDLEALEDFAVRVARVGLLVLVRLEVEEALALLAVLEVLPAPGARRALHVVAPEERALEGLARTAHDGQEVNAVERVVGVRARARGGEDGGRPVHRDGD